MSQKPRILALHGFRTSADIFKAQIALAALRKLFEAEADITYINAPHAATGPAYDEVQQYFKPPFYQWGHSVDTEVESSSGERQTVTKFEGFSASLDHLEQYIRQHGPFDGLMGFSQGAGLSALAALLQHRGLKFQDIPKIKFCILIAGGKCKDPQFDALYAKAAAGDKIPTPACIMIGDQDQHKAACEAVIPCFNSNLIVLRHATGHQVPRLTEEQAESLVSLIRQASG